MACIDRSRSSLPTFSSASRHPMRTERVAAFEPRYESRDGVANRFHEPVNYRPGCHPPSAQRSR